MNLEMLQSPTGFRSRRFTDVVGPAEARSSSRLRVLGPSGEYARARWRWRPQPYRGTGQKSPEDCRSSRRSSVRKAWPPRDDVTTEQCEAPRIPQRKPHHEGHRRSISGCAKGDCRAPRAVLRAATARLRPIAFDRADSKLSHHGRPLKNIRRILQDGSTVHTNDSWPGGAIEHGGWMPFKGPDRVSGPSGACSRGFLRRRGLRGYIDCTTLEGHNLKVQSKACPPLASGPLGNWRALRLPLGKLAPDSARNRCHSCRHEQLTAVGLQFGLDVPFGDSQSPFASA
jgi:hypothetical protein